VDTRSSIPGDRAGGS